MALCCLRAVLSGEDLDSGRLHALSLRLNTPEEYKKLLENQGK